MLKAKIQQDIIKNLKERNQIRVDTLRFAMSEIKNQEIAARKDLVDEEIMRVLSKQVKKLKEAFEMFEKGGRDDLASQNKEQMKILSEYLPEDMSDEALEKEIQSLIEENKELYEKNPKALIGIAMKKLSSRADPGRIMGVLRTHT